VEDDRIEEILYPVNRYPEKVKSLNLDKTPLYRGVLEGIRGQYLIFADGTVFNVRKHGGYLASLSLEE
jgi:predicted component of type VI protein secretion system